MSRSRSLKSGSVSLIIQYEDSLGKIRDAYWDGYQVFRLLERKCPTCGEVYSEVWVTVGRARSLEEAIGCVMFYWHRLLFAISI